MIAEGPLLEALEAVHSGRLRVREAYRQIRAAETTDGIVLTREEADLAAMALRYSAIGYRANQRMDAAAADNALAACLEAAF